jgi:menaquinone-9 beta-reductase
MAGCLPHGRGPPRVKPLRPIEIIGGGLAGLSLGLALRREGVPVVLFEAGRYPRHRVCGEFITGLTADTIARLGLAPFLADALQHREIAWFHRGKPSRIQRLPSPALGLSRHALDARLAEAFVASGGELRVGTRAADLSANPGRVLATGRRRGDASWIGLKIHARGLVLTRDLEVHLGEKAYVGLSAVEDGEINLCGLFRQRRVAGSGSALLSGYLTACGLAGLAARLAAAEVDAASFCAVAALSFSTPQTPPSADTISLGDAHGLIPPFTGNGMALAFQSAETALEPLLAYSRGETDWASTCRTVGVALHRRFKLRFTAARALHPFFLQPRRQLWLNAFARARLLPLQPLYSMLH